MSLTSIASMFFLPRQRELKRHFNEAEELQARVLRYLVAQAMETKYGKEHFFSKIKDYDGFAANVPVNTYEELKGDIDRMRHGESDVLWKGRVRWFAKSSGTTNDLSLIHI